MSAAREVAARAVGQVDGAAAIHVDASLRRGAIILARARDLDGERPDGMQLRQAILADRPIIPQP